MAAPAGVQQKQSPERVVEELNRLHLQYFNLQWVKSRAITLSETISRVLNDFDAILRTNTFLKWYYIWGKFSMVELGLSTLLKEIEEASKLLVVHPNNVNRENATVLPAMLSSKLLPEMEIGDNTKREQLLNGMENLPVSMQFEKLKTITDKIGAAWEGSNDACISIHTKRLRPIVLPTINKVQDAKIREQENLLRSAVNDGEGLRMPEDQRQVTSSLPMHLVDVLTGQIFFDRIWYYIQSCFTIFALLFEIYS
ncbi:Hypothetical predicted protein [Olea europaea subsp. europaea]|uniref:Uncharacterized protein n=1 Tax=Olea europaea subsp. europaea TaxID=158383 RepID=A0A8S0RF36_OLEEU|nr:Hypothetical predicted protein [Olea europaea subsp. europaea]